MTDAPVRDYVSGALAPVPDELTVTDLPVTGSLPAGLEGRYVRNGPNPPQGADPATQHWFLGTGMVHGVRLSGAGPSGTATGSCGPRIRPTPP